MSKSIKIYAPDKSNLMEISTLEAKDGNLVIKGKIMGSMPMTAVVRPEEARNVISLLNWKLALFLLSFLFRKPTGRIPGK
ncbi:hypothetical protein [Sphingobium sp. BS19]|jgi:hypothetical protein|uniref:hypothetical protein n=1 Tax=Sphingobium sp. BS19 TaxID=3018973 RepID=UPI0022EE3594|nr:hypothetical protein [Sphingobium sp. BS19]GLJ00685.1 hypothetical protein Sbs19_45050 [Sphingobium sp. BS19]